jgi:hypothetical protein
MKNEFNELVYSTDPEAQKWVEEKQMGRLDWLMKYQEEQPKELLDLLKKRIAEKKCPDFDQDQVKTAEERELLAILEKAFYIYNPSFCGQNFIKVLEEYIKELEIYEAKGKENLQTTRRPGFFPSDRVSLIADIHSEKEKEAERDKRPSENILSQINCTIEGFDINHIAKSEEDSYFREVLGDDFRVVMKEITDRIKVNKLGLAEEEIVAQAERLNDTIKERWGEEMLKKSIDEIKEYRENLDKENMKRDREDTERELEDSES